MNPNDSLPHRKKLRIPDFDYSQPGAYYVSIVTQGRRKLFGQIVDGEMVLNDIGKMVKEVIDQIPEHYPGINVELFVVMPNHIHALLIISEVVAGPRACQSNDGKLRGVDPTKKQLSLSEIVHRIKSLTTHEYMIGVRDKGWSQFEKRLWQRNYYEHVIRNERDYQAIYEYILANPMNWEKDEEFSNLLGYH
ncbi:MAG TPA: hypothetical protein PLH64_05305 [Anaerolineaceae bacterium]|nr:hypothetical protein [Anaerolineaceae bacterium]